MRRPVAVGGLKAQDLPAAKRMIEKARRARGRTAKTTANRGGDAASRLLKGTMIQTTGGDCKVEDLKVGDLLPTALGGQ